MLGEEKCCHGILMKDTDFYTTCKCLREDIPTSPSEHDIPPLCHQFYFVTNRVFRLVIQDVRVTSPRNFIMIFCLEHAKIYWKHATILIIFLVIHTHRDLNSVSWSTDRTNLFCSYGEKQKKFQKEKIDFSNWMLSFVWDWIFFNGQHSNRLTTHFTVSIFPSPTPPIPPCQVKGLMIHESG
jgi:hypothetical protein